MEAAAGYLGGVGVWPILLVIIGVSLIIVEMFVPGFGIPGILGAIACVWGIVIWSKSLEEALLIAVCVLVVLGVALFFVVRSAQKGRLSRSKIILKEALHFGAGYAGDFAQEQLLGKTGVASSELRPAGIGIFEGKRIDVVSDGEYIKRGAPIEIIRLEGRRIMVNRLEEQQDSTTIEGENI